MHTSRDASLEGLPGVDSHPGRLFVPCVPWYQDASVISRPGCQCHQDFLSSWYQEDMPYQDARYIWGAGGLYTGVLELRERVSISWGQENRNSFISIMGVPVPPTTIQKCQVP